MSPDTDTGRQRTIVFFDGYCGLCNRYVDTILAHPSRDRFRFSPQQGETFQNLLAAHPGLVQADSILVVPASSRDATPLTRSNAILHVFSVMGGWRAMLATVATIVPQPLRDAVYRGVAKTRYTLFGKRNSCRLPSPDEKKFFLP